MIYFVENLTSISFFFYLFLKIVPEGLKNKNLETKVYFIDGSRIGIFLATSILKLMSIPLERFSFCMNDLRDKSGTSLRFNVVSKDLSSVHQNIVANFFSPEIFFLNTIKTENNFKYFLGKQIVWNDSFDTTPLLKLLIIIKIISLELNDNRAVFLFINTTLWLDEIKIYALKHQINIVQIKSQINLKQLVHFFINKIVILRYLIKYSYYRLFNFLILLRSAAKMDHSLPMMAAECIGNLNLLYNKKDFSELNETILRFFLDRPMILLMKKSLCSLKNIKLLLLIAIQKLQLFL